MVSPRSTKRRTAPSTCSTSAMPLKMLLSGSRRGSKGGASGKSMSSSWARSSAPGGHGWLLEDVYLDIEGMHHGAGGLELLVRPVVGRSALLHGEVGLL